MTDLIDRTTLKKEIEAYFQTAKSAEDGGFPMKVKSTHERVIKTIDMMQEYCSCHCPEGDVTNEESTVRKTADD
jgi:hypothetical protein